MRGRTVPPLRFPPVIELTACTKDEAYAEAAHLAAAGMTGLWIIQVLHDDGCKASESQEDGDCVPPCQPAFVLMDFEAHQNFMQFDSLMRKAGMN